MTTRLSKIEVQKAGEVKKSKFNFSKDVASTYGFGEVQPLFIRPCVTGKESHSWTIDTLIRLSPMAVSTFGRMRYNISNHFVPFDDIYPSYKFVIGNQASTYNSDGYVPHKFPTITQDFLMCFLSTYPFSTYSLSIRGGTNSTNSAWQYAPVIEGDNLYKLGSVFPYSNNSFGVGSLFSPNEFLPYRNVSTDAGYLTPEAADFNCFFHDSAVTDSDWLWLTKLTDKGKRLYKVLTGLGYKPSFNSNLKLNLLPLLAFYKAYFDEYCIIQYQNWFETNAYKLIKYIEMSDPSVSIDLLTGVDNPIVSKIKDFLSDLAECWYSENPNFVSACTPADGTLPGSNDQRIDQLYFSRAGGMANANNMFDNYTPGSTPDDRESFNSFAVANALDQLSDEILKKLYQTVNRESGVGFDIKRRLIAKGYQTYVDDCESYRLGSDSIPIQISDVNSSAETAGAPLGAYTGKGVQSGENHYEYTNKELGYIISLGAISPLTSTVNALDSTLLGIDRYTFYNPEYDSLGMEPVSRAQIGHLQGTNNNELEVGDNSVFGYLPRYSGFKCSTSNVLNGEFGMKSARKSWLPYTLDQLIVENDTSTVANSYDPATGDFKTNDSTINAEMWLMPTAGEDWRYPTNASWKGNFNRIFVAGEGGYQTGNSWDFAGPDPTPAGDNFLVDNVIEHTAYITMLPISESWDTIDDEDPSVTITSKI